MHLWYFSHNAFLNFWASSEDPPIVESSLRYGRPLSATSGAGISPFGVRLPADAAGAGLPSLTRRSWRLLSLHGVKNYGELHSLHLHIPYILFMIAPFNFCQGLERENVSSSIESGTWVRTS